MVHKGSELVKTGVNTSIVIDVFKQREKKDIKPLKSNCRTCLYFNGKECKFKKDTSNRKHCIKYEYSNPALLKRQKKIKIINSDNENLEIKKTSFKNLTKFFGVPITKECLKRSYKNYGNGYGIKISSYEPLTITLRHTRTQKKVKYEIKE